MSEGIGTRPWPPGVPVMPVNIPTPDITPWLSGNIGIAGVWSFAAERPGPHVAVSAIVHGNEIAGATALDHWLRAGIRPACGRLSLIFMNLEAFAQFDPANPTLSRFVDEDMNRVWDVDTLEGKRRSYEVRRARELRPFLETVDLLVDLHSMSWPSDPLIVTGETEKAARLGVAIGVPPLVVSDSGHAGGRRLIDFVHFADPATSPAAVLIEAGPHWEPETIALMEHAMSRLLRHAGQAMPDQQCGEDGDLPVPRRARVTRTVTARSQAFALVREFRGGDVIARRNTLIAMDGEEEIRTPHDDCLLVMPTPIVHRGHTAVRLAQFID